jgi:glycerol-3-phosphate dehydrogenase
LIDLYGTRHTRALAAARLGPELLVPISSDAPDLLLQAAYAATDEMTVTLEDFMRRRSELMLFAPNNPEATARVAETLAKHLNWTAEERTTQIEAYEQSVQRMLSFRSLP